MRFVPKGTKLAFSPVRRFSAAAVRDAVSRLAKKYSVAKELAANISGVSTRIANVKYTPRRVHYLKFWNDFRHYFWTG